MFVFGHLGIGNKLASPWSRRLPKFALFLGMLLPDLIDKPLYYGNLFLQNHYGTSIPWIGSFLTCTRTFGHTGAFLAVIILIAGFSQSKWFSALGLGISTHLLLDCLMDRFFPGQPSSALIALMWPVHGKEFAIYQFKDVWEHAHHLINRPIIAAELIGLSLLAWDYWKSAHRRAIRKVLFSRRWRAMKRRRLERD